MANPKQNNKEREKMSKQEEPNIDAIKQERKSLLTSENEKMKNAESLCEACRIMSACIALETNFQLELMSEDNALDIIKNITELKDAMFNVKHMYSISYSINHITNISKLTSAIKKILIKLINDNYLLDITNGVKYNLKPAITLIESCVGVFSFYDICEKQVNQSEVRPQAFQSQSFQSQTEDIFGRIFNKR